MKSKYLAVVLFFFLAPGVSKLYASHIAGGELVYTWVSGSTYHFTFKLYRDCTGVAVSNSVQLCYKNSCNSNMYQLTLPESATINGGAPNGTQVSSGCPGYPTTCNPGVSSTIYGFEEYWYEGNVTLPVQCNKWTFSVTVSARNPNSNLAGSGGGFYVEATLNNLVAQGNSSAQFTVKPVPYVCVNQPYVYNNGAFDLNNDSLGYQIMQPETESGCNAAPTDIQFSSTLYNLVNNPIATNNTFVLDTITGQLNFTPSAIGKYTLALRVTEYRNKVAISTTMRDIQVYVIACSISAPVVQPDTATIHLVNGEIHDCGGSPLHFCFSASSTDTTSVLVASDNHNIVAPGSTLTYSGLFSHSIYGCFTWSPGTADTGVKILTVTVSDSSCRPPGIIESNTFTLPLYIFPTYHTNIDTFVCVGSKVTLTANGSSPYAWTALPGGGPLSALSCTTCEYPTDSIKSTSVTTTFVSHTTSAFGCPVVDTVMVIPVALPATPIVTGSTPLCVHDTLKLYAGVTAPAYRWNGPAGFVDSVQNPVLLNFLQPDTGMYYATTRNAHCASLPDSIKISVYPPTYALNPDTTICQGSSVQLRGVGITYTWAVLPGGSSTNTLSCVPCLSPVATPTTTTSYVISSVQTGCNTHDTVAVTVVNYPQTPSPTSNSPLCIGDTMKLQAGVYAQSYTWTGPVGFTASVQNPIAVNMQLTNAGLYHVVAANGPCPTTDVSLQVNVVANAPTPVITTNSPLCTGSILTLSAQDSLQVNYYWTGPNGFVNYAENITIANVSVQYAGLYTVRAAFAADPSCLSAPDSAVVVVKPKVFASFQFASDSICEYYPEAITYSTPGADSLVWDLASGTAQSLSANPLEVAFSAPGTQTVVLNAYNGVCGDTAKHSLYVWTTPPNEFTATPITCPGVPVNAMVVHDYGSEVRFAWNFGTATVVSGYGEGPYQLLYSPPGSYVISLVTQNNYCTSYPFYDTITAQPYPDASIVSSDISNICSEDSVHFSGADVAGYRYQWKQPIYFENDTLKSTYALIRNSGYIYLYVTDQYGCKAEDSMYIAPPPCCSIYFPNSFTPNGDGKNDVFRPITAGHHDLDFFNVFNRWGQLIYSSANEKDGWNGTAHGIPVDAGTYFYTIRYKCVNGEYFSEKGEVILIR